MTQHPRLPGLDAHMLSSDELEAVVVPKSGARVASLVDRVRGIEWMWAPPGTDSRVRENTPGDDFATGPSVGADECIPTVGACRVSGVGGHVEMPDHGEVWARSFDSALAGTESVASIGLHTVPLHFRRAASVRGATLRMDYTVRRLGDHRVPWLWSWHPLFVLPEEATLALEGVSGQVRFESGEGVASDNPVLHCRAGDVGTPLHALDLGGPGRSAKLFLDASAEGAATLTDVRRGSAITVRWSGEALRGLGVWINRGGWNGYQHMAIEPCTEPVESADQVRSSPFAAGSDETCWSLDVTVHAAGD